MFRSENVGAAMRMYGAMFSFDGQGLSDVYAGTITSLEMATLALAIGVAAVAGATSRRPAPLPPVFVHRHAAMQVLVWPLFLLAVLKLSAESYSPFLYFQF
jgi:alginate O-acetyltransferase complex protein AlgI